MSVRLPYRAHCVALALALVPGLALAQGAPRPFDPSLPFTVTAIGPKLDGAVVYSAGVNYLCGIEQTQTEMRLYACMPFVAGDEAVGAAAPAPAPETPAVATDMDAGANVMGAIRQLSAALGPLTAATPGDIEAAYATAIKSVLGDLGLGCSITEEAFSGDNARTISNRYYTNLGVNPMLAPVVRGLVTPREGTDDLDAWIAAQTAGASEADLLSFNTAIDGLRPGFAMVEGKSDAVVGSWFERATMPQSDGTYMILEDCP